MTRHPLAGRHIFLLLLLAINVMNFFDRQVLSAVTEPLRLEWMLTDTQIGWLGTAFTILYAVVGVPLGRLADLWQRRHLMAIGLALWSVLTFLSGSCRGFGSLFAARLGVGVGEATCAPAATSLIGDLFASHERGRAMSIFMLGLPLGLALSSAVSGAVAEHFGWRYAFWVAGVPGLILAGLLLLLREPRRGQAEVLPVGSARRPGSPYLVLLRLPTMWVIALSGALHNFSLYGLGSFLPAYLTRFHHTSVQTAGFYTGLAVGVLGGIGMLLGGWLGDAAVRRRRDGRLLLAALALLLSAPVSWLALEQPAGSTVLFAAFMGIAYLLMYVYYSTVYATIHDIAEPALRGTAMAIYFLAMYLLGASLGPLGIGWLSDSMARRSAGTSLSAAIVSEQFKAAGLHDAMYVVPLSALVLTLILIAGVFTLPGDMNSLRRWMSRSSFQGR